MQDKTEAATPRRREEAREEGRVAQSADVSSALVLLVSLLVMKASSGFLLQGLTGVTKGTLSSLTTTEVSIQALPNLAARYGLQFAKLCLPVMAVTASVGLAANILQVGFKVSPKAIRPDMSRIDPFKGVARLVSARSAVELLKSTLKVGIIAYFIYSFLRTEYPVLIDLAGMPPADMAQAAAALCWRLVMRGCITMLIIGILDYMYQRLSFENSLKMTKQEIKEEYKRQEGDPLIKSRIKRRQSEMARSRMMQDVKKADVVVTNPTHYAVAIQYDAKEMVAPVVLAKGQRLMALRIREIAQENGIPIVENPPVARLLYKVVEVGQAVPEDLYQAVAEILAYVYQLGQKATRRGG